MSRYQFGERKRIKEAEGKLRVFQQTEKGCLHYQVEGKHKSRKLPRTALAANRSSCAALPRDIFRAGQKDQRWGSGLWCAGQTPAVSHLSDKAAGMKAPSMHGFKAPSSCPRAQLHIGGCGSRAGLGSAFPGPVDLPSDAPCHSAQRMGLWHHSG